MAPPPLDSGSLPKDELEYDILYSPEVALSIAGFTDGAEASIDFEVRSPDGSEIFWVRVTPDICHQNDNHPNLWHIESGTYRRLQKGVEVGNPADVSGWLNTIANPGATAGKLSL